MINKLSIPADIALGESSTHWWTRFNAATASIPFTSTITAISGTAAPPTTSITNPSAIAATAAPPTISITTPSAVAGAASPPTTSIVATAAPSTTSPITAPFQPPASAVPPEEPPHIRLPAVKIPSLCHRQQPSRLKRPSFPDEKENPATAMAPQTGSAEPEQTRMKWQKIEGREGTAGKLFFKLVSEVLWKKSITLTHP